jgi:photosystem II stability/assembly factor-like uncharacterized protein
MYRAVVSNRSLFAVLLLPALIGASFVSMSSSAGANEPGFKPLTLTRAGMSNVIYVVGSTQCSQTLCLRLLRTTDDGTHFTPVSLPPIPPNPETSTGMLTNLVFANANVGYALLGGGYGAEGYNQPSVLYATFNGARTWHKETINRGDSIFAFEASAKEIYAVTAHCHATTLPCQDYQLARSTLTAKKWIGRSIPGYSAGLEIGLFGAYGSNVWLDVTQLGLIDTSHNDAKNFSQESHPHMGSPGTCDLTATSTSTIWAKCPTGMLANFQLSTDGGTQWNVIPTPEYANTGGGNFDPVSNALAYFDQGPGQKNTKIYRIVDAGRKLVLAGTVSCRQSLSYVFTSKSNGLALCLSGPTLSNGQLLSTSDGGVSWTALPGQ